MEAKPKLIAVVGTNASGKSGLGVELAARFNGEVISADSRQVFRGMDLGSGKITPDEMMGVPHHLLDVVDPGEFFSMGDFQRLAYSAIEDVRTRGKVPFLVGGTGLYTECITEGYVMNDIMPDLSYRRELEEKSTEELYLMLMHAAPDTVVDAKNRNRVMRLLEKIHDGDTEPHPREPRYRVLKLGVTWDRETLARRIDERLEKRMKAGMVNEVRQLMETGASDEFLMKLGLEYRFLTEYIRGGYTSEKEMCVKLAQAIRKFAKRQQIWYRRDPEIHWLDMKGEPFAEAEALIDAFLREE